MEKYIALLVANPWTLLALLASHILVAWMFYRKGVTDTVMHYQMEQEQRNQQELWKSMIRQHGGHIDV